MDVFNTFLKSLEQVNQRERSRMDRYIAMGRTVLVFDIGEVDFHQAYRVMNELLKRLKVKGCVLKYHQYLPIDTVNSNIRAYQFVAVILFSRRDAVRFKMACSYNLVGL